MAQLAENEEVVIIKMKVLTPQRVWDSPGASYDVQQSQAIVNGDTITEHVS